MGNWIGVECDAKPSGGYVPALRFVFDGMGYPEQEWCMAHYDHESGKWRHLAGFEIEPTHWFELPDFPDVPPPAGSGPVITPEG